MVVEKQGAFGCPWYWATNSEGKSEPFFGSDRHVLSLAVNYGMHDPNDWLVGDSDSISCGSFWVYHGRISNSFQRRRQLLRRRVCDWIVVQNWCCSYVICLPQIYWNTGFQICCSLTCMWRCFHTDCPVLFRSWLVEAKVITHHVSLNLLWVKPASSNACPIHSIFVCN